MKLKERDRGDFSGNSPGLENESISGMNFAFIPVSLLENRLELNYVIFGWLVRL